MSKTNPKRAPRLSVGERFNPHGMFYGVWIPDVLLPLKIPANAKLLYGRLARYAGKDGLCFPSQQTQAHELGLHERQIRNLLRVLEESGFIRSVQRGLGQSNCYEFLWHQDFASCLRANPAKTARSGPAENYRHGVAFKESPSHENQVEESPIVYSRSVMNRSASREKSKISHSPLNGNVESQKTERLSKNRGVAEVQKALFAVCGEFLDYPDAEIAQRILNGGRGAPPERVNAIIAAYGRRMERGDKPQPKRYGFFLSHVGDYFEGHPEARKPFQRQRKNDGRNPMGGRD
jgi:Helix-turn-helix domain